MMNHNDKILEAREKRALKIADIKKRFPAVMTIKSNTPGKNKNTNLAFFLVKRFSSMIQSPESAYFEACQSEDGYYHIIGFDCDPKVLKKIALDIEENDILGRFIDIDVHDRSGKLPRPSPRKCFVCDKPAFDCIRNARHQELETLKAFQNPVETGLRALVMDIMRKSVLDELDLEPKFGLVTKSSSGVHADMDYAMMMKAYEAIADDMYRVFSLGFNAASLSGMMPKIRLLGIEAEQKMDVATSGINAYKGLIFSLGIILAACGYLLKKASFPDDIFRATAKIAKGISAELKQKQETFGEKAYMLYGFTGARGEAESGFASVKEAMKHLVDFSWEAKIAALIHLIVNIEDTVFLKRSGSLEDYRRHRKMFAELAAPDIENITRLTEYCNANNLSFGGAADLLVVACFLKRWKACFYNFRPIV